MKASRLRRARWLALLLTTTTGGTMFVSCATQVRVSAVQGAQNFVLELLNPEVLLEILYGPQEEQG